MQLIYICRDTNYSSLHGYAGDPGMNTAGLYPDPISGYVMAVGVMAALHHRDRTGEPQRVDLAMMEALTTVCGDALVEYQLTGEVPKPLGNRHPRHAPHNNFECRDQEWIALAIETQTQWNHLAAQIGGALGQSQWSDANYRKDNEDQLEGLIAQWCLTQDASGLEAALCPMGIPAARVVPLYELYTQVKGPLHETGFIQTVNHPEAGPSLLPGAPWHFSGSKPLDLKPAPRVGEHSREILREELGLDDEAYEKLVKAGITGTLEEHAGVPKPD